MSDFVPGFVARHAAPIERLRETFACRPGFVAAATKAAREPAHFSRRGVGPKHFSPADPDHNPTEGWDPLDPNVDGTAPGADPIEAARTAGFQEGVAAALAAQAESRARDEALIAGLAEALSGRIDREALAGRLRATVLLLVRRLVGEAGVSVELLAARVRAATELLAEATESALLRVNPDDVPLLEGKLPDTVFAAGDAGVARGSFVLESASTVVEDGPEAWLEQLAAAIDRVSLPAC